MNLIIMGVCGCGKSTVGEHLAAALDAEFIEGDSFHPPENVQRMSAGIPLTDADRAPWLSRLTEELARHSATDRPAVLACSALKRRYREQLSSSGPITFVYLKGDRAEIERRMALRQNHFMVASMVASQFEALEEPGPDEPCIRVSILRPVEQIVNEVLTALKQN